MCTLAENELIKNSFCNFVFFFFYQLLLLKQFELRIACSALKGKMILTQHDKYDITFIETEKNTNIMKIL